MDAKMCDRCGVFYIPQKVYSEDKFSDGRPLESIQIFGLGHENSTVISHRSFDICPECSDEFRAFFGKDKTHLK